MYIKLSQKLIAILKIKIFTIAKQRFYTCFLRLPYDKIGEKANTSPICT